MGEFVTECSVIDGTPTSFHDITNMTALLFVHLAVEMRTPCNASLKELQKRCAWFSITKGSW